MGESSNFCESCVPSAAGKPWWIYIGKTPKWIRVKVGEEWLADSKRVLVVNEAGRLPVYYFPKEDVKFEFLKKSGTSSYTEHKGVATYWDIVIGDRVIKEALWEYEDPEEEAIGLKDYITFEWKAADHWYEEEEEVFVHARDPYTRIDTIPSSRHVQVILNGEIVADSVRPIVLFETGLSTRYYLPAEDVRLDLLTKTDLKTRCPYKGEASYWTAEVNGKTYENIVWSYEDPIPELPKVKGLLSFYNENVDEFLVDGEKWELEEGERLPFKVSPTDKNTGIR